MKESSVFGDAFRFHFPVGPHWHSLRIYACLTTLLGIQFLWQSSSANAGHVVLKNTITIQGTAVKIAQLNTRANPKNGPVPIEYIWMIDNGIQRYFVPTKQVNPADINQDEELSKYEEFAIPQRITGPRKKMLQVVGSFTSVTPFNEFGRRTVTVATNDGSLEIVQAITLIRPDYVKVTGMTHLWEFALATSSIPPIELDAMIRKVTDQASPTDRMAIYRFYLQGNFLTRAATEMESIQRDFPDLRDKLEELNKKFLDLQAQQITTELRHRRDAGQHRLAELSIRQFPVSQLSPTALREVRELTEQYSQKKEQIDLILSRLGELQSAIKDEEQLAAVAAYRSVISEQLDYESLNRMSAFLNLQADESLSAEEKLALAYSGWVLGGEQAVTKLDSALRLWQARFLCIDYIRTDNPNTRGDILKTLKDLEGVGPETIAGLIPYLPPLIETPEMTPDEPFWVTASKAEAEMEVRYQVLLPHEYSPHHRYPLIVSLHAAGKTPEHELRWWGGTVKEPLQSRRRGYIVIAPLYVDDNATAYDFSAAAHKRVLQSLSDARKRFHIDSDRVFLAGHGMGGDAAFDIGMSRTYEFAGVIPFTGLCDHYCRYYWENARRLPWYIVSGELDRFLPALNAQELDRMMKYGFDVIYTEYSGRGYETYYSEIHKLFDWMEVHRRKYDLKEIKDHKILRPTDNRAYWIRANDLPPRLHAPIVWKDRKAVGLKPVTLSASILDGSSDHTAIHITSPGDSNTLWLSPRLVDYSKRLTVRVGSRQKFNDFLQPEIGHMLDDLRARGDREHFCWTHLEF